jgi:hypothetical protein
MTALKKVGLPGYAGLFFITLATLMYEILLTRIFSVTMWYHFAFMAISVAMFGMTVGAIIVYLFPGRFDAARAKSDLGLSALLFAVTVILSFLIHLRIPFVFEMSLNGFFSIAATYTIIAVPFIFSGICVCIALTKFPAQISKLYAVDLAGAALGCFLLIVTLNITDGPTGVIVVASLAALGAFFFALQGPYRKMLALSLAVFVALACFASVNTIMVKRQRPLLNLKWVKGERHWQPLYEKWNSFSYFKIIGNPTGPVQKPSGWGLSPECPQDPVVKSLLLMIDAFAGTPLTNFDNDLSNLEFLKYDIINLAHFLREQAKVCVVGVGGGRDILSALVFKQPSIIGIEINPNIIEAVNGRFGDFTGHIDQMPGVTIVNDEARSYITRSQDVFDIIQVSFIDTWAATAAGAFVLTESSLYTVEAWEEFFKHLTDKGILTFSRWYFQDNPGEVYRLTALATAALLETGVATPREHIILVRNMHIDETNEFRPDGVGTILVSKSPFSPADIERVNAVSRQMKYEVVLSPDYAMNSTFERIASGRDLDEFTSSYPIDISPTTDNNPFFFNQLRLRDIFSIEPDLLKQGSMSFNMNAVFILGSLLLTVIVLTGLCIIVPLLLTVKKVNFTRATPFLLYFACIGMGFMLVEIALMQRLIVFLGNPVYSLSVVLFALLLSGGLGSFSTARLVPETMRGSALIRLALLLLLIIVLGGIVPLILQNFQSASTGSRILIAILMILPVGFLMGMAFPIGMRAASTRTSEITAWLWGINGATSVCASVIAIVIALAAGISASYWTGFAFYLISFVALWWALRQPIRTS